MRIANEKARDRSVFENQTPQGCPCIIQGRKYKQFTKMADNVKKRHTNAKGNNVSKGFRLSSYHLYFKAGELTCRTNKQL
jgi:hypothetical protein